MTAINLSVPAEAIIISPTLHVFLLLLLLLRPLLLLVLPLLLLQLCLLVLLIRCRPYRVD
jgi:hypothetical protein